MIMKIFVNPVHNHYTPSQPNNQHPYKTLHLKPYLYSFPSLNSVEANTVNENIIGAPNKCEIIFGTL